MSECQHDWYKVQSNATGEYWVCKVCNTVQRIIPPPPENQRITELEAALVAIFRVTLDLTTQSRLSAAGPGAEIARIVYDALGKERLEQLLGRAIARRR